MGVHILADECLRWRRASASLAGNRITEGRWDTLFSAMVAVPALPLDSDLVGTSAALLAMTNIGTHCIIANNGGSTIKANNLEIYPLKREIEEGVYNDCDDIELFTDGVSGVIRRVGAHMLNTPLTAG
jgi:hypothetical protein